MFNSTVSFIPNLLFTCEYKLTNGHVLWQLLKEGSHNIFTCNTREALKSLIHCYVLSAELICVTWIGGTKVKCSLTLGSRVGRCTETSVVIHLWIYIDIETLSLKTCTR